MYYVITDTGVKTASSPKAFKNLDVEAGDFTAIGKDHVTQLNADDLTFIQDRKVLSSIPIRNLFKPDNTIKILIAVNILLTFICMVKG